MPHLLQIHLFTIVVLLLLFQTGKGLLFPGARTRTVHVPVEASKFRLSNGRKPGDNLPKTQIEVTEHSTAAKPLETVPTMRMVTPEDSVLKQLTLSPTEAVMDKEQVAEILSKDKGLQDMSDTFFEKFEDGSLEDESPELESLMHNLKALNEKVDDIEDESFEESTSFMACAKNGLHKYRKNMTVQYRVVRLNEGMAYKAHTSTFTCPLTGLYRFDVSVYVPRMKRLHGRIMVGGKDVAEIAVNAGKLRTFASRTVITECSFNQTVKLQTRLKGQIYENINRCLNSFSGQLIKML